MNHITYLARGANCLFPAKALPAAFFTNNVPVLKALAEMDTEAAKAKVTKIFFAIVMADLSFSM
jgi:hypothetical protein